MKKSKYTWKVPSGKFGTIRDFTVIDQNCGFRTEFSYFRFFFFTHFQLVQIFQIPIFKSFKIYIFIYLGVLVEACEIIKLHCST